MPNPQIKVTFPVFAAYQVRVVFARDIVKTGRALGAELAGAEAASITRLDKPLTGWLIFQRGADAEVIAHEASHAIRAMFDAVGVGLDDEAFAYHVGYLVARIDTFIKRCHARRKQQRPSRRCTPGARRESERRRR